MAERPLNFYFLFNQKIFLHFLHPLLLVKIKYRDLSVSRKIKERLKFIFRTKLFKAAMALFLIGIVMVVASFVVGGTYYYNNNSSHQLVLDNSSPQVVNVSQLVGSPLNLTFILPQDQSLHYRVYTVLHFQKDGVIHTYITNITSGTAINNSVASVNPVYSPQTYLVELTTTSNASYNVTLNAIQAIPQHIPSNLYLGFPGASILVLGAIALSFSITRGFK